MFEGVLTSSKNRCHQFQKSDFWKALAIKSDRFFLENILLLETYFAHGISVHIST